MDFKKKCIALSAVAASLFVIYILTFVFSSEDVSTRRSFWTPISNKDVLETITSIEIKANDEEEVFLEKVDNFWKVVYDGEKYPAQDVRVQDFLSILTKSAPYPVCSTDESKWSSFGVDAESARRLTLKTDETTLGVFFFGNNDATGQDIYLRREGEKEVRSGEDVMSAYLNGQRHPWYDLHLFPNEDKKPAFKTIQRLSVTPPGKDGKPSLPYTLARRDVTWHFDPEDNAKADSSTVDTVVRYILDASADDFVSAKEIGNVSFTGFGSVALECDDLSRITLALGPKIDERQIAKLSTSEQIFVLSDWVLGRIWRDKTDLLEKK